MARTWEMPADRPAMPADPGYEGTTRLWDREGVEWYWFGGVWSTWSGAVPAAELEWPDLLLQGGTLTDEPPVSPRGEG